MMLDSIRALLKTPKGKGKSPTAAQLAEALEKGKCERDAASAKLGELRDSMGSLLLEGSAEAIASRESEIHAAELTVSRWDAVLQALDARRQEAEAAEEGDRIDAAISRAAKLVRAGQVALREYDTLAKGVAEQLRKLEQLWGEWRGLATDIERAGRETDLVAALDGDGASVHGPGFIPHVGLLQRPGWVELPSLAYRPHWGSHLGAAPETPETEPEPDLIAKHFPKASIWKTGRDGQLYSNEYQMTREAMEAQAEQMEAAGVAPPPLYATY